MNNLIALNNETYEIIFDKILQKNSIYNNKEFSQISYSNLIELIKELVNLNKEAEYYILKFEGKNIIFKKSNRSKLGLIIISEQKAIKKENLIELSKVYLSNIEKVIADKSINSNLKKGDIIPFINTKDIILQAIEELTIKFIENLRKNKLYAKFVYYNYNPNVVNSMSYKKSKLEPTSVVLYNSNKEQDKM